MIMHCSCSFTKTQTLKLFLKLSKKLVKDQIYIKLIHPFASNFLLKFILSEHTWSVSISNMNVRSKFHWPVFHPQEMIEQKFAGFLRWHAIDLHASIFPKIWWWKIVSAYLAVHRLVTTWKCHMCRSIILEILRRITELGKFKMEIADWRSQWFGMFLIFLFKYRFQTLSKVVISFKERSFIAIIRSETSTMSAFISNCGGLFGLFMGASVLSIVELVYYFTLRLYLKLWRQEANQSTTEVFARTGDSY